MFHTPAHKQPAADLRRFRVTVYHGLQFSTVYVMAHNSIDAFNKAEQECGGNKRCAAIAWEFADEAEAFDAKLNALIVQALQSVQCTPAMAAKVVADFPEVLADCKARRLSVDQTAVEIMGAFEDDVNASLQAEAAAERRISYCA